MTQTPAGWYPDPENPGQERYWTGEAWTDQRRAPAGETPQKGSGGVRKRLKQALENPGETGKLIVQGGSSEPEEPQSAATGWYPDPENADLERRWDGEQWTEERRQLPSAEREAATLRPDIQAAKERMNIAWGGRRELRKLTEHLWPDEEVNEITTGTYGGGTGLIVLTDRRLLFLKEGWVGKKSTDFPLEKSPASSSAPGCSSAAWSFTRLVIDRRLGT
jgi:hypothetical protein